MRSRQIRETVIFAMLGALMFCSKIIMEFLPNIHLLSTITAILTIVYRRWAILAIFVYVFLTGVFGGFGTWWLPYLYIWPLLWGVLMIIPQKMSLKYKVLISAFLCALHGFAFGILYAPAQAILFNLNFKQTVAWVISGLYFDFFFGVKLLENNSCIP